MFDAAANTPDDDFALSASWSDASAQPDAMMQSTGIVAGTLIATAMGWRPVEGIVAGDVVMTFDHGPRPVIAVKRMQLCLGARNCPRHFKPLAVPVGALGNKVEMLLLPEQTVLVESDAAEAAFDDPFALIQAAALEGYRGIARVSPHYKIDVVVPEFECEEVIYANGTGMMHCGSIMRDGLAKLVSPDASLYNPLPMEMACSLVGKMIAQDVWGTPACATE
ncbi:hypothetical protein FGG78_12770 [Thioclava sp. BHET1]|nr:hypothetical protein FGG78_12770 [Thioclava sp. BHET1]